MAPCQAKPTKRQSPAPLGQQQQQQRPTASPAPSVNSCSSSSEFPKLAAMPVDRTPGSIMAPSLAISVLEGALLKSHSFFPYYMLLATEAGSPIRALLLLAVYPLVWISSRLVSEAFAIRIMVFVSIAGLRLSDVCAVAQAVLPKHFMEDINLSDTCCRFFHSKRKVVLTSHPRIMVQHFLSSQVGVETVLGTEVQSTKHGVCTGLVGNAGVLADEKKAAALRRVLGGAEPDVGFGSRPAHKTFVSLCKDGCIVLPAHNSIQHRTLKEFHIQPVIFHDGRLVLRPTPMVSIAIFLWVPFGFMLMLLRLGVVLAFPDFIGNPILAGLGMRLRVQGAPPLLHQGKHDKGVLYVCTHRTPVDPIFVIVGMRRSVRALTYSVSRFSEIISPIKTSRLRRDREKDAEIIREFLKQEDLIICPEGTTCREPFLLRFSPLFADVADVVVPIAVNVHMGLFQGTSARGHKSLDPIFLLMNPQLTYDVAFLEPLALKTLRAEGRNSIEIANLVQKQLGEALGFDCTTLTRRDKYTLLAGNDGMVKE